jgi:hypothetical protein
MREKGEGRREKGEGRREKGEGRREKGGVIGGIIMIHHVHDKTRLTVETFSQLVGNSHDPNIFSPAPSKLEYTFPMPHHNSLSPRARSHLHARASHHRPALSSFVKRQCASLPDHLAFCMHPLVPIAAL